MAHLVAYSTFSKAVAETLIQTLRMQLQYSKSIAKSMFSHIVPI